MPDERPAARSSDRANPYAPIAIGFYLLSLPLWISILLAGDAAGAITDAAAAAVMVCLGLVLHGKQA